MAPMASIAPWRSPHSNVIGHYFEAAAICEELFLPQNPQPANDSESLYSNLSLRDGRYVHGRASVHLDEAVHTSHRFALVQ